LASEQVIGIKSESVIVFTGISTNRAKFRSLAVIMVIPWRAALHRDEGVIGQPGLSNTLVGVLGHRLGPREHP
jgi:hypothetical protein